jgi:citrate lyase subunit beta/citryl-CoA lyase
LVERLRRSFLYTPGDSPGMVVKAADAGADAVTVDLEDAVRPEDKPQAREHLRSVRETADFGETELAVRVNGFRTDHWAADLDAAVDAGVDTVTLPMVETPRAVEETVAALEELTDDPPELVLLLESPAGVFAGREVAEAAARFPEVTGLSFGVGDYARATGGEPTSARVREFLSHRVVGFAALGRLQPISSVYPDPTDLDALREIATRAAEVGFVGQSVIHPRQVPVVNEVFTPDPETVATARAHVEAYDASDRGAFVHEGTFLDEALVERYRRLVARADAIAAGDH